RRSSPPLRTAMPKTRPRRARRAGGDRGRLGLAQDAARSARQDHSQLGGLVLVSGHVRSVAAQTRGGPADLEAATGAAMAAVLDEHRATYARARAAFAAARRDGEAGRALEFGVDRILDGLARYAES